MPTGLRTAAIRHGTVGSSSISSRLGALGLHLRKDGYCFCTPTPLTQARVLARRRPGPNILQDVFGWNKRVPASGFPVHTATFSTTRRFSPGEKTAIAPASASGRWARCCWRIPAFPPRKAIPSFSALTPTASLMLLKPSAIASPDSHPKPAWISGRAAAPAVFSAPRFFPAFATSRCSTSIRAPWICRRQYRA